jgi:hypothetical protein
MFYKGARIKTSILIFIISSSLLASSFVEIPQKPDSRIPFMGWLLHSNDGFGHNYGTDEDNLRTYGINTGASFFNKYLVSVDWSCFTDRNSTYANSKRIDELKVLGSYRWLDVSSPLAYFSVHTGPGFLVYGNLGTLKIQEGAHKNGDAHPRPVPETYDGSSQAFLGYVYSELYFPKLFTNITMYSHLTNKFDYNADVSASGWIVKSMIQSSFAVSYQWNKVDNSGLAAHNCYLRENGFWLSNKTMIGPLLIERGFNTDNLNQYSFVGFRLGDHRSQLHGESSWRFSYSIGWPIGHNSWIEFFRAYPFPEIQRLDLFLRTYHTENTFNNNTIDSLTPGFYDARHLRRIKETSIGAEFSFNDPSKWSLFDGFVFGGVGFTQEMFTSYDQLEARIYDLKTEPMVHAGCGIRLAIPDFVFHVPSRYIGAEIRANVRYNAKNTGIFSNPDLLLDWGLVFSEK